MPFHLFTDTIVQGFINQLHTPGAERLADFLQRASQQTTRDPEIQVDFHEVDFEPGTPVRAMRLARKLSDGFIAIPDIKLADGTRLDRIGLHLPGTTLPETVLAALAGRKVGDVVQAAVLADRVIESARNLRSMSVLRLPHEEAILSLPPAPTPIPDGRVEEALAPTLSTPCDPLVVAMLRAMPPPDRKRAIIAAAHLEEGCVQTDLGWSDVSGGVNPPDIAGHIQVDPITDWGVLRLERRKGKPAVHARVGLTGDMGPANLYIEHGFIQPQRDFGAKARLSDILGFVLPGDPQIRKGSYYGNTRYALKPTMTLGDALHP